jgi:predicted nucleic acid-binding Zn ribbon protein
MSKSEKFGTQLQSLRKKEKGECEICGAPFIGYENKRFCSNKCRVRNHRLKKKLYKSSKK